MMIGYQTSKVLNMCTWRNDFKEPSNKTIPEGTIVSLESDYSSGVYKVIETIRGAEGAIRRVYPDDFSTFNGLPISYDYTA